MIDALVGLATLPVSVFLFWRIFGGGVFDRTLLLIGAACILANQLANMLMSHQDKHKPWVNVLAHGLLLLPALAVGASMLVTLPPLVASALPLVVASFLFVEGVYSLFLFA